MRKVGDVCAAFQKTNSLRSRIFINFAEKGQTIAGHEYTENGKFDANNTDLNFGAVAENYVAAGVEGLTPTKVDGKHLQITIELADTNAQNYVRELSHEAFYHAENFGKDFLGDKKLNRSNVDSDIRKTANDFYKKGNNVENNRNNADHHMQGDRENINHNRTLPTLQTYFKSQGIKKSDKEIKATLGHM